MCNFESAGLYDFLLVVCSSEMLSAQLISCFKVAATYEEGDGHFKSLPKISKLKTASSKLDEDLYQENSLGLSISSSQVSSVLAC